MNLDDIINSMTPEVYQRLSTAVELGEMARWRCVDRGTKSELPATGDAVASSP
ncbi:putative cytoplasmic protein [Escherichia coli]|nr:putative cytoplasmic protein [Escherichia coli]